MNNRGVEMVNVAPYIIEKEKLKDLADKARCPAKEAERIIKQMVNEKNGHKRQPKPPAPEGGISIRAAGRKYKVAPETISGWVKKEYIPIILRTKNELYIDEAKLAEVATLYKEAPGQGRSTLKQALS